MIKIIKDGDLSTIDPIYIGVCARCKCKFECNQSDAKSQWLSRNDPAPTYFINCPTCKDRTTLNKK